MDNLSFFLSVLHFLKLLQCLVYLWPFASCLTKAEIRKLKFPACLAVGIQEYDTYSTNQTYLY